MNQKNVCIMKKFNLFVLFSVFVFGGFSQAPQSFKYQAVVRNASNQVISNQSVSMQISIIATTPAGSAVYVETHQVTTSDLGLVTISIGEGAVVSGVFANIPWGTDLHFVKIEVDPLGGTSYVDMGTTQLLSVPYALHAKYADNTSETDPVFSASPSFGITAGNITNWNTAFGWGNHATAGYLTSESDPTWNGAANETGAIGRTGNVGIGTTTTAAKLHVQGATRIVHSVTPSLYIQNDANSYSTKAIQLYSQGGERAFLSSNGGAYFQNNVGIGTTSPTQRLDIDGQIRIRGGAPGVGKVLTSNADGTATWETPAGGGGSSNWTLSGSNIHNSNSGNVGIGSITPVKKLDVVGESAFSDKLFLGNGAAGWSYPLMLNVIGNYGALGVGDEVNLNNLAQFIAGQSTTAGDLTGIKFAMGGSGSIGGAAIVHERTGSWSQGKLHFATKQTISNDILIPIRMTIDQFGNVGIGTTTPESKLHVYDGHMKLDGLEAYFDFNVQVTGNSALRFYQNNVFQGGAFWENNFLNFTNNFFHDGFVVDYSKNIVGVRTRTPQGVLHVVHGQYVSEIGTPSYKNGILIENSHNNNTWQLYTSQSTGSLSLYYAATSTGAPSFVGSFDKVSGAYTSVSDMTLKHNVKPLESVMPKVLSLQPKNYSFIDDATNSNQIGFISQEVEKLFPELVIEVEGIKMLNYSQFSVIAIKAIQEQQSEIEQLRQEVEELKQLILSNQ
jgi:hypothetical protein